MERDHNRPKVVSKENTDEMHRAYQRERDAVKTAPFLIQDTTQALKLMPFDTGIEIECTSIGSSDLLMVPGTLIKEQNHTEREMRYRLAPGKQGMLGLWAVCTLLIAYGRPNYHSGIHYHIDMSFVSINSYLYDIIKKNENFYLNMLDSWNYKGRYNSREFSSGKGSWVRYFTQYNTLEVRIGEMTFDYSVIIKRILCCQAIVKDIRTKYMDII